MPGPEFFQTIMGQRFFNAQLPALIENLGHIASALKKIVEEEPQTSIDEHVEHKVDEAEISQYAKDTVKHILESCRTGRWSSEESNLSNTSTTELDEKIRALLNEINEVEISPIGVEMFDESMDNLVHQLASEYASSVNNEGRRSQIEYILKNLGPTEGPEEVRKLLKEAVEA